MARDRPADAIAGDWPVKTLRYQLKAVSRVSAGRGPEVLNSRQVHVVLPGRTVRGALATAWLRDNDMDAPNGSPDFESLFEDRLTVRPAIPEDFRLFAMSHVRCKYPDTSNCLSEWHDQAADVLGGTAPEPGCPGCAAGLDRGRGWANGPKIGGAVNPGSGTVATTRTELTVDGTAKDERLFTRRAVERGARYGGDLLLGNPSQADVDWLCGGRSLRVGGQRSVLGEMSWSAGEPDQIERTPVSERMVLRLVSPTILVDQYGAASLELEPELRLVLGEAVRVERCWTRPVRIAGWHMASGLAKPEDWALEAGGTFVVSGLPPKAREILEAGVGLRRREGFGQVLLLTADDLGSTLALEGISVESVEEIKNESERLVERLLSTCPTEEIGRVGRAVIDGIGRVRLASDHGSSKADIDRLSAEVLAHPWARSLPAETRDAVEQIFRLTDLPRAESVLRARMEEGDFA